MVQEYRRQHGKYCNYDYEASVIGGTTRAPIVEQRLKGESSHHQPCWGKHVSQLGRNQQNSSDDHEKEKTISQLYKKKEGGWSSIF